MITPARAADAQAHLHLASQYAAIALAMATEAGSVSPGMQASAERQAKLMDIHFRKAADALGFEVIERIGADLSIKGMSIETRIDQSRNPDAVFFEALSAVRREMAYTRWRAKLAYAGHVQPVLAMIVQDMSLTAAATLYPIGVKRLKRVLRAALDDWGACLDHVYKTVSHGDMVAAQAGLL